MNYLTEFFGGLVAIMISIIPVSILWSLLTGSVILGMDIVGNFMAMVNALGNAGFVGLLAVVFIMYFFMECKRDCKK